MLSVHCGSEKQPPPVGDDPTTRSDGGPIPIPPVPEAGSPDSSVPPVVDSGMPMPPSVCTDANTCAVALTSAAPAIPADGKATTVITATVDFRLIGSIVEFSIRGPGTWVGGGATMSAMVDATGKATATLQSDAAGGTATITAKVMGRPEIAQLTVDMPALADITYSMQHTLMGVESSGFNETNRITFKILAPNGVPYPAGLSVAFEHKPLAGSKIGSQPTCTMLDCIIKDTGVTDDKGLVQLNIASGTLAGQATVTIIATAGGQTKRVDVSSPIVGAKVSGSGVSIECTPRNVPAFADTDCIRSRVDSPFKCTVTLADRFNNSVGISTTVKFQSEAGIVGTPQTMTPMYPSADLGKATGTIGTVGGVLPVDVPPLPGEYSAAFADSCHPSGPLPVHNPRDGIVSVIAMMTGEEGFIDRNGDGKYNQGEPFIDLAEPFIDANDNGVQDGSEFFQDLNNDTKWNGPNGEWDDSTMLWTETRIVYSGGANSQLDTSGSHLQSRFFLLGADFPPGGTVPMRTTAPVGSVSLVQNQTLDVGLWFSDFNFNVLAPTVKYTAEVGVGDPASVVISSTPQMLPRRQEGFFFSQLYCDGANMTSCEMVCPPTPATQQCVVRSAVTDFEYGVDGVARIRASASLTGPFSVAASAALPSLVGTLVLPGDVHP